MATATLSVLVALFNEEEYVRELLDRVAAAPLPPDIALEIIVVDDGSTDRSAEVVRGFLADNPAVAATLLQHGRNRGKGAAIRTAIAAAGGEYSVIQDADLEYDPAEYPRLLGPLLSGKADVVFGSRFASAGERRVLYYWHALANRLLTTMGNIAADLNLTDMCTCYKAFRTALVKSIPLSSERFGIEPELTIKLARRGARVYETPISYYGRTYEEGKKVGLRDAFEAVWVILRARLTSRLYVDAGPAALEALAGAPEFNRWMANTIAPWVGSAVVEIGAGIGNVTRQLCRGRKLYLATDYDPHHIEQLRRDFQRWPTVQVAQIDADRDADFTPFAGRMDTVVCLNVLEHIQDDRRALERMRTLLAPGGRLILLVPNDPAAFGTLDTAVGHFRRYTVESLQAVVESAGFRLEKMLQFNRVSRPGWRFTGQVMKAKSLSPTGMRVFDRFVWVWRRIDASLPWPATSIIAIASAGETPV